MQRRPLRSRYGRCIQSLVDALKHCMEAIRFQRGRAGLSDEESLSDAGLRDVSGYAFPFREIETIDRSWGKQTHCVRPHHDRDSETGDLRGVEWTPNGLNSDICHFSDYTQGSRHGAGVGSRHAERTPWRGADGWSFPPTERSQRESDAVGKSSIVVDSVVRVSCPRSSTEIRRSGFVMEQIREGNPRMGALVQSCEPCADCRRRGCRGQPPLLTS